MILACDVSAAAHTYYALTRAAGRLFLRRGAIALLLAAGLVGGCGPGGEAMREYAFSGATMGTFYTVKVIAPQLSSHQRAAVRDIIVGRLETVDESMSTFAPDSELSRFNGFNHTAPFPVSPATAQVFARALEVSAATDGAFDITVGPLVNAWGFGPAQPSDAPPTDAELAALRARVGYEKLSVDLDASTIAKARPDIYCDLSAIAKGYAVDEIAAGLAALGCQDFMVDVGGEVRTRGRNAAGVPWQIGIARPLPGLGKDVQRVVPLANMALATSGDYQNYYERNGKRFSHMIDPATGRPIDHNLASVSVLHESCAVADAYATGLMVLGPDRGCTVAQELDLAALFIIRERDGTFTEKVTAAFKTLSGP